MHTMRAEFFDQSVIENNTLYNVKRQDSSVNAVYLQIHKRNILIIYSSN